METEYFLAADKRFYEPITLKPVEAADYLDFVEGSIDEGWKIIRKGVWINCHREKNVLPLQGWKIHLSTIPADSRKLLRTAASHLIARGVSFKFLADAKTLGMTNSKSWTRGGSGKFITIYPADLEEFKRLLAELEPLTREFRGPYILSDRRYKDSKVLYYRYGGIRPNTRLQADGSQSPVLVAPDGREIEDVRNPTYGLPDWVEEPFPEAAGAPAGTPLNSGRYTVERALHFSTTGGVYIAQDAVSGKRVVLKEARAHVHTFFADRDAADMLRSEFETLKKVEDLGAAPKPIELFREWEHLFLAEEYIEGYLTLQGFSSRTSFSLNTRPTREAVSKSLKDSLEVLVRVARIVDALHARGILWGDISANNILVHPETLDVRIIDLEGSQPLGGKETLRIATAGFVDVKKAPGSALAVEDDYYGVGALMVFLLTHANFAMGMKPEMWKESLAERTRDFGLPAGLAEIIGILMNEDPALRRRPSVLLEEFKARLEPVGPVRIAEEDFAASAASQDLSDTISQACRFIKSNADGHRKDRLFPADTLVFDTNPVSLAHGAAGVLHVLNKVEGAVDPGLVDWLLKAEVSARSCPPGLYVGLAGVAWALLDLGREREARETLQKTEGHPLLASSSDLYHGMAGWGMTNLHFWVKTRDRRYLDAAQAAGRALLSSARERDGGLCWPGKGGVVSLGLGHGSSGIGLFLLYLDRALGGGGFEDAAVRALDFEIGRADETAAGGLTWRRNTEAKEIVVPYWKYGSAGVGIAALRFLRARKETRYRDLVERIYVDCDRKYAVWPGRNDGLTGIGEFHLDAFLETGDRRYLNSAYKVAAGLKSFRIQAGEGAAFLGNGLSRISCDLTTGAAGIVLFLDRLRRPRPADFLVDEVLK